MGSSPAQTSSLASAIWITQYIAFSLGVAAAEPIVCDSRYSRHLEIADGFKVFLLNKRQVGIEPTITPRNQATPTPIMLLPT